MIDPGSRVRHRRPSDDAPLRRAARDVRARLAARRRLWLGRAVDRRGAPRLRADPGRRQRSGRGRDDDRERGRQRRRDRRALVLDGESDELPACRRRGRERAPRAGGEDPRAPRRAVAITSGYLPPTIPPRPAGGPSTRVEAGRLGGRPLRPRAVGRDRASHGARDRVAIAGRHSRAPAPDVVYPRRRHVATFTTRFLGCKVSFADEQAIRERLLADGHTEARGARARTSP